MLLWPTLIFLVFYTALFGYYLFFWTKLPFFSTHPGTRPDGFISVIVAARNEAANIERLIAALQAQTLPLPQFEVIVVDDYSTDATAELLHRYISDRFRVTRPSVPPNQSSKKKAIEAGVQAARGPLLAITDADCVPPPRWLEQLLAFQQQRNAVFVAAPVRLQTTPTLLGIFQSLDFTMLQAITAASVQGGAHSMCNGANLAYKQSAFNEAGGFAGIDAVASGDDMLLMYKIWQKHPQGVHYLKSHAAIMPTPAMPTWQAFWQQRIRWSSKATHYQDWRVSAALYFVFGFNLWALVLVTAAIFTQISWQLPLVFLAVKTGAELLLLFPATVFFGGRRQLIFYPLLQPLHILYTIAIGFASRGRSYQWKGRTTR
jgi:cellulose synthase/poly-beta-1,6-N-acetylglucosamine synthase-like glycosyltransferase